MALRVAPTVGLNRGSIRFLGFVFTQDSFYADFMDQRKEAD